MSVKYVREKMSISDRRFELCEFEYRCPVNRIFTLKKITKDLGEVIENLSCDDLAEFGMGLMQINLDLRQELEVRKRTMK